MIAISYRNANFHRAWIVESVVTAVVLALNIMSSFRLGELGLGVLAFVAGSALYHFASWHWAVLEVRPDGVTVSDLFGRHSLTWADVDAFEIRPPRQRSPLMLMSRPWADQARVRLADGARLRIRAVEPYHGSAAPTLFSLRTTTKADELVASLNQLRAERVVAVPATSLVAV
jgi:Bacterial PH domain